MNTKPFFSIITPVYGCKTSLFELFMRLKKTLDTLNVDFEIIMVNDGSPDGVWETIIELSQKDQRVKGINLSRNFGQHNAITAGLDHSKGEWVVVMDCDLQDQPEEIGKLYEKALEGYDYVLAKRKKRNDRWVKRLYSKIFNHILSYLSGSKNDASIANFGIFNRKVVQAINTLREKTRWFPSFVGWVGYKGTNIEVVHASRQNGNSSYSFRKLVNLALDVIILNSDKPLKLVVKFGFLISFSSLLFAIITLGRYFKGQVSVLGWTSLIISIWFLSGIIIFILGIIGLYLAKIYDHSKDRPLYIIKENTNLS